MILNVLTDNDYNSIFELRKSIFSVCEKLEKIDKPLDDKIFENSINEINCSIDLLTDLKSTLNDNQYRIDYEINGNSSIEIWVDYDYEFESEDEDNVYFTYTHPNGSSIISLKKETIKEYIKYGEDLDSIITEKINSDIRVQYK